MNEIAWTNHDPRRDLRCPLDGALMEFVVTKGPTSQSVPVDIYACPDCVSTFNTVSDELVRMTMKQMREDQAGKGMIDAEAPD